MRPRNVIVDGVPCSLVPAPLAGRIARQLERDFGAWPSAVPIDPELVNAVSVMRVAELVAPAEAFQPESPSGDEGEDGPMATATELAEQHGLSRQWVTHLCRAGALPGARRSGRVWLVPVATFEQYNDNRQDHSP